MILRVVSPSNSDSADSPNANSASEVFIHSQKAAKPPYALIFQAEHSRLAGALASGLRAGIFGELPPQVIQAIAEHDFGWGDSDQRQVDAIGTREPRPFPNLPTEETLAPWNDSVSHARQLGPLQYVMVSRHFTLLGGSDPKRATFVAGENSRRPDVERSLGYNTEDLNRWTAAIGFCDLLSLYLCSGILEPVEFPLAHPADPSASQAPKVTLFWEPDSPRFSVPVMRPGLEVSLNAMAYIDQKLTPVTVDWKFA